MKRKHIFIVSTILAALSFNIIFIAASNASIPEPSRVGKEIPKDVVWDSTRGVYKVMENNQQINTNEPVEVVKLNAQQDEWIEKNKNSSDPLDMALIKWLNNRKLNAFKSYYSSDEDYTFKEITNLGIKYLPEIIDRIYKDDGVQTGVLMDAFSKMSQIDSLKEINLSSEGKYKWISKYKNALKKASQGVQNNSDIESLKKECGIFITPYLNSQKSTTTFDTKIISTDEINILKTMVEKQAN